MSTPPSPDRAAPQPDIWRREHGGRRSGIRWARCRARTVVLGPGWVPAVVLALVVGGVGGVLPVAIFGESGQGFAAGALSGFAAASVTGPIWVAPLVASAVCVELELGAAALLVSSGRSVRSTRWRRRAEAVLVVVLTLISSALMGLFGAVITNAFGSGEWSLWLDGAPGVGALGLAVAAMVVSLVLSMSIAELCGRRLLAILVLEGSLSATLAFLAILHFAPVLQPLQMFSPWVGVWPLRAAGSRMPLFATNIDSWRAGSITAFWTIGAVVAAVLRPSSQVPAGYE